MLNHSRGDAPPVNIRIRVEPESLTQALAHAKRAKNLHDRIGLCWPCANALAWGHQEGVGFAVINPPCTACTPTVATLPVLTTNPLWRTVRNSLRDTLASPLKTPLVGTSDIPSIRAYPHPANTAERAA